MNYYQKHLGDYAKKTGHLTPLEHGIYNLIMDGYYDREQAPTLVEATRWARARTDDEKSCVQAVLDEFFVLGDDGRYRQSRIEDELSDYRARAETNRVIAVERERKRRERIEHAKSTNRAPDVHQGAHDDDQDREPSHKPIANSHKPIEKHKPLSASPGYPTEFEEAWEAYPPRPGASKKDAHKAWVARIKEGVLAAHLLAGVQRYANYVLLSRTEPQYTKQPATFFGPGEHYLAAWEVEPRGGGGRTAPFDPVAHVNSSGQQPSRGGSGAIIDLN